MLLKWSCPLRLYRILQFSFRYNSCLIPLMPGWMYKFLFLKSLLWLLFSSYFFLQTFTTAGLIKKLIEERTGAKPGGYGAFFKLNPRVDDIPQKFGIEIDGVRLLVAGTVKAGGSGCYCPENVLLKNLFRHLLVDREEIVILDMEAGIEHLGRGTCESMDALIIVVEPGLRSVQTARTVRKMSLDLGIRDLFIVVNKVRTDEEEKLIEDNLDDFIILGKLPYSDRVRESDLKHFSPCDADEEFKKSIEEIAVRLNKYIDKD
ncbi:hypothetical protein ES708_19235 [subsurface metagenome]